MVFHKQKKVNFYMNAYALLVNLLNQPKEDYTHIH